MSEICPKCKKEQWSPLDRNYLKRYSHCWSCDKKEWEKGNLSLERFEERERRSLGHES